MASKQQLKMPQIRKKKKTNKKSPKLNFLTEFDLKKKKKEVHKFGGRKISKVLNLRGIHNIIFI